MQTRFTGHWQSDPPRGRPPPRTGETAGIDAIEDRGMNFLSVKSGLFPFSSSCESATGPAGRVALNLQTDILTAFGRPWSTPL